VTPAAWHADRSATVRQRTLVARSSSRNTAFAAVVLPVGMPFDSWSDSLAMAFALFVAGTLLAVGALTAWCG